MIKLRELLLHRSAPFYPLAFGILILLWGIWLVLPFDVYSSSPSYTFVSQVTSEMFLGILAILIGAFQAGTVLLRRVHWLPWVALFQFHFWLFIALSFILSNWHNPGTIIYSWVSLMNGFGYINWRLRDSMGFAHHEIESGDKVS